MDYLIILLIFLIFIVLFTQPVVSNFSGEKRVAICIYGRTTTWRDNIDDIKSVFDKTFNCPIDYFASVHADANDPDTQDFIKSLNPVKYNVEKIKPLEGLPPNKQKMVSSFYHKYKCSKLVIETGTNYDWVVLTRIDLNHNQDVIDLEDETPAENTIYVPTSSKGNEETKDRSPDQVNAGSLDTIKTFTEIYEQDHYNYVNVHPEQVIYRYMTPKGIKMKEFLWNGKPDPNRVRDAKKQDDEYDG